ncbi:hypothetical protein A2Z56_02505 [Candidatus Kaiserbacteria bacterium RIFCSPHIGHO2_12_45_16]|nr:MAG: hypothetical protein A2Z56_02505 [Candidatus Kaiserbacteria bacterium RIFCSPHIGHO2_12_45_16]
MKFYFKVALVLVIIFMVVKAWAVPPEVKAEVLTGSQQVHQGLCIYQAQEVKCQIFYRESDETVYLVLYTNDTTAITHVVKVKDKVETILWINPSYSM